MKIVEAIIEKLYWKRTKLIGDAILPFINAGDSVLDFGCSTMAVSKYVSSKKEISFTGLDTTDYDIKDAGFIRYDGGRLPFDDNQFDVVFALFVLHHTDDPVFYLDELIRVSKSRLVVCEDTYVNKIEEIINVVVDWILNYPFGGGDVAVNFKSVEEWKNLFKQREVKLATLKRFYPHPLPFIPTRNMIMELRK